MRFKQHFYNHSYRNTILILSDDDTLQDNATPPFLLGCLLLIEDTPNPLVKHLFQPSLGKRGAFHVLIGANFVGKGLPLLEGNGLLTLLGELLDSLIIRTQIKLGTHENEGNARGVVVNLLEPLAVTGERQIEEGGGLETPTKITTSTTKTLTYFLTLSKLLTLVMAKQIKNTSVWG